MESEANQPALDATRVERGIIWRSLLLVGLLLLLLYIGSTWPA